MSHNRAVPSATSTDRRAKRTRAALHAALIALVSERGYDAVTVADITAHADISRPTFYLHYSDKEALLAATLSALFSDVDAGTVSPPTDAERARLARDGVLPHMLDPADFTHVAQYARFYQALLSASGAASFTLLMERLLIDLMTPYLRALAPHAAARDISMAAQYFAGGEVSLMRYWLVNDLPDAPEVIAKRQYVLCTFGLWAFLGVRAAPPQALLAELGIRVR